MTVAFSNIPGFKNWDIIKPINKGWSDDKKYYIKTKDEKELLLRLSDISQYENKKKEFESLKPLTKMDILFTRPIDFGTCNDGQSVYSILTWIDGEEASDALPALDSREQYMLGNKAGMYLKQIHSIPAPQNQPNWAERFNRKIDRKIANYKACSIHFHSDDRLIDYIEQNRSLLINRSQSFQHGDYHVGNMIITPKRELGIIDFNRMDYGDPWEEFNRITWCVEISPMFASGYINGYFDNAVPGLFFRLMALYIASNQLSSIPWAIPFGEKEVDIMLKQTQSFMKWYDGFKTHIPNWYVALD
ncbi:phosphotransferase family protein [Proteiniborus sp. MB09-C3]|uniref:aminoglycoside phosphotransferase family protein n=1 Tax=Proteiniborus sp. MB09-C3 TaxID=3050072 RepID=UPI00255233DD|nr:phosphotransferase family protein [Proteiniborus sp. MB09-C3]WIV12760.1 phosphotransferase family protein [Proteiniborus sp. MB09-C3]